MRSFRPSIRTSRGARLQVGSPIAGPTGRANEKEPGQRCAPTGPLVLEL
eukprot:COSAG02_NODE_31128_length_538_cov_9.389522_2_plen_48_part_01